MEILFTLNRIHKFLWILFCIIDTILHNHIQLTNLFYYFSIFNKNPIDNSRIYIIFIQNRLTSFIAIHDRHIKVENDGIKLLNLK